MNQRLILFALLILVGIMLVAALPVAAQDGTTQTVTDDQVNAIAKKLFCPVCENIPLDTCGTKACADWRDEIRFQLESGMTEQQIIDDFVYRFGDRVVGTPKSAAPRLLSLVTPVLAIAAGLYLGLRFYNNHRQQNQADEISVEPAESESTYHDLLEKDVSG